MKTQYCEFEGPAIVMGWGQWMTKIVVKKKKIEDYKVGQLFFDIYQHLAEPDDEATDIYKST